MRSTITWFDRDVCAAKLRRTQFQVFTIELKGRSLPHFRSKIFIDFQMPPTPAELWTRTQSVFLAPGLSLPVTSKSKALFHPSGPSA